MKLREKWNRFRRNESKSTQDARDNNREKRQNVANENVSDSKPGSVLKIITDEPATEDVLDFSRYSEQLANIIMNSTARFTIGIFGGWGTGKTTLMKMIEKRLQDANSNDILVVWFDAWKYEKEKYLAIVPFIRTIELTVENKVAELEKKRKEEKRKDHNTSFRNTEKWNELRNGFKKTLNAFIESTNLSLSIGNYGSAKIDLAKFRDVLKTDGQPIEIDNELIYYHNIHVTDYIKNGLSKLIRK